MNKLLQDSVNAINRAGGKYGHYAVKRGQLVRVGGVYFLDRWRGKVALCKMRLDGEDVVIPFTYPLILLARLWLWRAMESV